MQAWMYEFYAECFADFRKQQLMGNGRRLLFSTPKEATPSTLALQFFHHLAPSKQPSSTLMSML